VVTIVLAWLFLGESMSLLQIAGGGLILLAVLLISRETSPEAVALTDLHD